MEKIVRNHQKLGKKLTKTCEKMKKFDQKYQNNVENSPRIVKNHRKLSKYLKKIG